MTVPSSDVQSLGLLRGVRMLCAGVALQLLDHRVTERTLGQHALDGLLKHARREALLQLGEIGFVDTALVTRMALVLLVLRLVTGHTQLLDIHDDDVVTGVHVRGEDRLVLAAQTACDLTGEAPEYLVRGIDNVPVAHDFMRLG
jgi:hypothetical protein